MRYWIDTEFVDAHPSVHLISIGIVAEDGREYYAELDDVPWVMVRGNEWLTANVVPHLAGDRKPRAQVATEIEIFLGVRPEIWLWYGAYDWVALTQLWGKMVDAPAWALEEYYHDIRQVKVLSYPDFAPPPKPENAHNALADARWTRDLWKAARQYFDLNVRGELTP